MAAQLKSAQAKKSGAFGLKGNLLTLTVMHLFQADLEAIRQQLHATIASTPKFFAHMPIVVDLQHLASHPYPIDYTGLLNLLREHGLIPVGVSNGTPEQLHAANVAGLGTLSQIKKELPTTAAAKAPSSAANAADTAKLPTDKPGQEAQSQNAPQPGPASATKLILNPIRSGQQVYAKGGDLVIIATVSAGAEVLADGNIHIYGTLRGRALAGVQGDKSARIFCHGLQAELISIAGHYKLQDNIHVPSPNAPVQVFIQDDQLEIQVL